MIRQKFNPRFELRKTIVFARKFEFPIVIDIMWTEPKTYLVKHYIICVETLEEAYSYHSDFPEDSRMEIHFVHKYKKQFRLKFNET